VCLGALYFELVMSLMRMYDNDKPDTICFEKLFEYLSDNFIMNFEKDTNRETKGEIKAASDEFKKLKSSHLIGGLKTARNKMFAHTAINFNRNQIANYEHATELLERTLPLLNKINLAINGKTEPYDRISKYWKGYAINFWQNLKK